MPSRVFAFLDTNVLIHGLAIEQIDWPKRLGADEVVLVLASEVMRELDRLKDGAEGRLPRNRARDFLSRFKRYEDDVDREPGAVVRDQVWLRALPNEPRIRSGFDEHNGDDRIINSILEFDGAGARLLLIARDTGIRVKARANGIERMSLPEELELKAEPDETERELAQARKELDRLRNRVPRIRLALLKRGVVVDHIEVTIPMPRARSHDEIDAEVVLEYEKCTRVLEKVAPFPLGALFSPKPAELPHYIERFREYVLTREAAVRERWRRVPVHLQLRNEGTVLSTQVEIDLRIAPPFEFAEFGTAPRFPRRPVFTAAAGLGSRFGVPFEFPALRIPHGVPDEREPEVRPQEVSYVLTDLMHNDSVALSPFDVLVPFQWSGAGFALDVTVRVAEVTAPDESKFHFHTTIMVTGPVPIPEEREEPDEE